MPSLLNLIPNAVGQRGPQIIYAEVIAPAPPSFTSPLYVVMPDWSVDFPLTITDWPAVHGSTLPIVGNAATLLIDSRGVYRCVWWDGSTTPASIYTTATKPAASTVPAGTIIFVSDGGGGAVFQGSTGSAWVNLG